MRQEFSQKGQVERIGEVMDEALVRFYEEIKFLEDQMQHMLL